MKLKCFTIKFNCMSCVISTLITCNYFCIFRQKICNFSFSFVAPLCTNDYN